MPVDRKRINGPEESVPYELFARLRPKDSDKIPIENNANNDGIIQEGRKICMYIAEFMEQVFSASPGPHIQTGIVSQAKGSSYIEIGETKVIVSVFDPREIPNRVDYGLKGEVSCEFKFAPFSCTKRKLHQQNNEEKQYSSIMKKALESAVCLHELPNFQVDVYSLVLQDDGSALSGAIVGAGVALAEAGVPMYDVITSATLGILEDSDSEKKPNYGTLTVSKLHTHQQICQFYQSGYISRDKVKTCIQTLSKACDDIVPIVKKCLLKGVISNI